MNEINALNGDKPTDSSRQWNMQPPPVNLKYRTYTPKTTPVVLDIMGRLNHHVIDNGNVEVHPSEYPFEYTYGYVTDMDTTMIKSMDDY